MNVCIVKETSGEIKRIARKSLENFWVSVVIAMAIYLLLTEILPLFLSDLSVKTVSAGIGKMKISYLAGLYEMFTRGAFLTGLCSFMLMFFRKRDPHPGYIFNGFGYYFKTFFLMIVVSLFTFLWSLLFLIPGIIAVFRYSQAFYILAEHPEKPVMQCLHESKMMMQNNKMRYFLLDLSFIGWALLLGFGQGILTELFHVSPNIVTLLFLIPSAAYAAYLNTAEMVFYEIASGNFRQEI